MNYLDPEIIERSTESTVMITEEHGKGNAV